MGSASALMLRSWGVLTPASMVSSAAASSSTCVSGRLRAELVESAAGQGGENGDGEETASHAANYWVCQRLALVSYSLHALCCVDATCCMLFLARRDS